MKYGFEVEDEDGDSDEVGHQQLTMAMILMLRMKI